MSRIKPGETTYVTYLLWNEDAFAYHEYVMNCTRSGVDPSSLDAPPLSIVKAVRRV